MEGSLSDRVRQALEDTEVEVDVGVFADGEPTDEIVEALLRQLDILEGSVVILANMVALISAQAGNLRSELELFGVPAPTLQAPPEVKRTPSGAVIEASLPDGERGCTHPDAILVSTIDGPQRVCPDCTIP